MPLSLQSLFQVCQGRLHCVDDDVIAAVHHQCRLLDGFQIFVRTFARRRPFSNGCALCWRHLVVDFGIAIRAPQVEAFEKLAAGDLYSPVSGEILGVNQALTGKPELVNEDSPTKKSPTGTCRGELVLTSSGSGDVMSASKALCPGCRGVGDRQHQIAFSRSNRAFSSGIGVYGEGGFWVSLARSERNRGVVTASGASGAGYFSASWR